MFACLSCAAPTAHAAPLILDRVLVVLSHHSPIYEKFLGGMRSVLAPDAGRFSDLHVTTVEDLQALPSAANANTADLIVSVGSRAAEAALKKAGVARVYCALIPATTYTRLGGTASGAGARNSSAVYLDQPVDRQVRLLQLVLPAVHNVGVVLGPVSKDQQGALRAAADRSDLHLDIAYVEDERSLYRELSRVLRNSEALLALADPIVFNRYTAQNILLETYHERKAVIGHSHAYVEAGALAAVYSEPEQIGRQVAENLLAMTRSPNWQLPPPSFPRYYTVDVNRRVADSLGLTIDADAELATRLAGAAGQ